jgi:hypothetical protein
MDHPAGPAHTVASALLPIDDFAIDPASPETIVRSLREPTRPGGNQWR